MASTEEPEDPFEGLVLDEDFVRGASRHEPPARTRQAIAKNPEGVPHRAWDRRPVKGGKRRGGPRARTWTTLAVVAAVLAVVGYVSFSAQQTPEGDAQGSPGSSAAPTATPTSPVLNDRSLARGSCYTWDQDVVRTDVKDVSCAERHLFEFVTTVQLRGTDGRPYPQQDSYWDHVSDQLCDQPVAAYLQHPLDPHGRLDSGLIHPLEDGWVQGERDIQCGVVVHLPAAFGTPDSAAFDLASGKADGARQELLHAVGTCLHETRSDYGTVPCSAAHTYETTGVTTVTKTGAAPSLAYFERVVYPVCERQVRAYLGRAPRQGEGTTYELIDAKSWAAGSRRTECHLDLRHAVPAQQAGSHQAAPQKA